MRMLSAMRVGDLLQLNLNGYFNLNSEIAQ